MKGGTSDMRDPCVFMAAWTFSKLGIFGLAEAKVSLVAR